MEETVEISLTPKQIQVVYNRFLDMGHEWVTMKGAGTEKVIPANPRLRQKGPAILVIPKSRVAEAVSILDSAVDITRDWISDPTGRAEHYATIKLYEKVKAVTLTKLTGDIWNSMTPIEREQLGVKAELDAATRGEFWSGLWPEQKRALIREFKKEQLAIPKAVPNKAISELTKDHRFER